MMMRDAMFFFSCFDFFFLLPLFFFFLEFLFDFGLWLKGRWIFLLLFFVAEKRRKKEEQKSRDFFVIITQERERELDTAKEEAPTLGRAVYVV